MLCIIWMLLRYFKKHQPPELQKYMFPGFLLRVVGTIFIAIIYQYIYGYGDTYAYYTNTQILREFFYHDFTAWVRIMFSDPTSSHPDVLKYIDRVQEVYKEASFVYQSTENANVSKVGSLFNIFCFDSYLGISLCFGTLSFLGCWYIFKTFTTIFPGFERQFAYLSLYIPSLWFWGSGILKDPISLFGLGILFFNIFASKKNILRRSIFICLGAVILFYIKSYIFFVFALSLFLVYFVVFFNSLKLAGKGVFLFIIFVFVIFNLENISDWYNLGIEEAMTQSRKFFDVYAYMAQPGDSTIMMTFENTTYGFFKLCLQGFITVFTRPYPWELRKIVYLFVILENLFLYYLLFKKIKYLPTVMHHNHSRVIGFAILFSLFMGIVVGATAFNLGTITRYRLPALALLYAGVFAWKLKPAKKEI